MPKSISDELRDGTSCNDCSLGKSAIYRGVIKNDARLIRTCRSNVVQYGPNRVVIRQDQIPAAIYTVYKGWLYRYQKLTKGRQQIISFIIPGDTVPFSAVSMPGMPLCYGVKSITEVELCAFDGSRFRQYIAQEPAFAGPYQSILGEYLSSLHRRIADMGQRSAKGQVAQLFLELLDRHKGRGLAEGDEFVFPVSQELLANALGMTKAYINRILLALRSGGIIQLHNRRLKIANVDRLKEIAESE